MRDLVSFIRNDPNFPFARRDPTAFDNIVVEATREFAPAFMGDWSGDSNDPWELAAEAATRALTQLLG